MEAHLVEALFYLPGRRGLDSLWGHWNFWLTYKLPAALWPWSTQPDTEMSTISPGDKGIRCLGLITRST